MELSCDMLPEKTSNLMAVVAKNCSVWSDVLVPNYCSDDFEFRVTPQ